MKLNPEDFPGLTPEQLEILEKIATDAGRELRAAHYRRTPGTQRYIDSGEYGGEYAKD